MSSKLKELHNREIRKVAPMISPASDELTSIVILSFNRKDDIAANLKSLDETVSLPYEVVVFDNGSEKETLDYLDIIDGTVATKYDNGLINVVYNGKNEGCSVGRKKALKYAKGDYIYTADNDLTYTPNWLDNILLRINEDPKIGAASSMLVYPNGAIQCNGGTIEIEDNYFVRFFPVDGLKSINSSHLTEKMDCDWLPGGATLIRKEVSKKVEHDERYINGYEDYNYSMEIKNAGFRIVNCPNSIVIHHCLAYDSEKAKKEVEYKAARYNWDTVWPSMLRFLSKTGLNLIKDTRAYDWKGFNGLGDKAYIDLSLDEVIEHFNKTLEEKGLPLPPTPPAIKINSVDYNLAKRQEVVRVYGLNADKPDVESIEKILSDYDIYFDSTYNKYNLAKLSREIRDLIAKRSDSLRQGVESSAYFFDFNQNRISKEGVDEIKRVFSNHGKLKDNKSLEWMADYLGEVIALDNLRVISPKLSHRQRQEIAMKLYDAATQAFKQGDYSTAIYNYNKSIELNSAYSWAYHDKALALERQGRYDEAQRACNKFRELNN